MARRDACAARSIGARRQGPLDIRQARHDSRSMTAVAERLAPAGTNDTTGAQRIAAAFAAAASDRRAALIPYVVAGYPDANTSFDAALAAADAGADILEVGLPYSDPLADGATLQRAASARRTGGFLYCVSLVGVTGARTALPSTVGRLVRDVRAASPVPVAVGFGVSRPAHVRALARAGADGVIVASALVDTLGSDGRNVAALGTLVAQMRSATQRP